MILKLCNCGRRPKTHGIYTHNKVGLIAIECPSCDKSTHINLNTTRKEIIAEWNDILADASADEIHRIHEKNRRDSAARMQRYINQVRGGMK